MTRLRLLADDLTGALDSAARFVPLTGPVATVWRSSDLPKDAAPGAVAIDAGTRDLSEFAAQSAMECFAPSLRGGEPAFKKIDSLLRGHIAPELAACLRGFDHCILAPAFPYQGRITRGGRQFVRTAEGWQDTGVDLAAELLTHGIETRIHDAQSDDDLDAIVAAGRALPGRVLWCGTGGLAGALAGRSPVPRPVLPRPLLGLIGSDHPTSLAQLAGAGGLHHRQPASTSRAIDRSLAAGAAVVSVELPDATPRDAACRQIVQRFAAVLHDVTRPGTLIVAGGETLRALCDALGATSLLVDGEIAPGVPTSVLCGGVWDGQRLVSKSGAFGDATFLARLLAES